ncbi:hypothetical protein LTR09_012400 [Extremus antarcticus]|uniref:N-acetyltransferase domain-containing protein n=1 Tax=Extremus antarcticus TaxID=702011 RepID=A0AAJ0D5A5_9PEZI|nr:hypothetical protein LTR09_012400 [Extremus antarcticus]
MGLDVEPADESDMDRLIEIQFSAFEGDPYHEALYPGDHFSPALRRSARVRYIQEWREDVSVRWMKCTDRQTGTICGFAKWNLYETDRPEEEWKKRPLVDWCSGRNAEVAENFLYANAAMREKTWGGRPYSLLNILCVHRDFQRRGAGTLLVQWGLVHSERVGLPAYLEASPAGFPLYLKLGFHQIDVCVIKAGDWDGDFDRHLIAMLKNPHDASSPAVK